MVNISKSITAKIQEKRSDLTSDEVRTVTKTIDPFVQRDVLLSDPLDDQISFVFAQSWY